MHEGIDPNSFVDKYGPDAVVRKGQTVMTLGQALAFEALLCEAPEAARTDSQKRISQLAIMLHDGGSLLPEDLHLLPSGDTE